MKIFGFASCSAQETAVILREKEGANRCLIIWINPARIEPLIIKAHGIPFSGPQAHDFNLEIISRLDARISCLIITKFEDNKFHANLVLDRRGEEILIDCRPSDALILCTEVPIYSEEKVLEEMGAIWDAEAKRFRAQGEEARLPGRPSSEEERENIPQVVDFIASLKGLDDFGPKEKDKE